MDGSKPLTSCPICDSRLIYPVDARRHPQGGAVLVRRCPECEHSDIVITGLDAARRWGKREQRIRAALVHAVLELEVESILAPPAAT